MPVQEISRSCADKLFELNEPLSLLEKNFSKKYRVALRSFLVVVATGVSFFFSKNFLIFLIESRITRGYIIYHKFGHSTPNALEILHSLKFLSFSFRKALSKSIVFAIVICNW